MAQRVSKRRWWFRLVLLALIAVALRYLSWGTGFRLFPRIEDRAGLLTLSQRGAHETVLDGMFLESGVDIRFAFLDSVPGGALEEFSVRRARELGIGQKSDRRGILFAYDVGRRQLRIEVGPNLEGIFPDAFIGYLLRENLQTFLAADDPELALRSTLLMLQARIREATFGEEYDPAASAFIEDRRRLALGAGASRRMPQVGTQAPGFLNSRAGDDAKRRFAPQPTPEASYHLFLEWLSEAGFQTDVPLFDPASRAYLAGLRMSRAYNDYILWTEYGHAHAVDARGDLALLYFTDSPLISPHLLRRTPAGWQVDILAEVRNTTNYYGGGYTWGYVDRGDDYSRTFTDLFFDGGGGILRVRAGDNRPLPTHWHPGFLGWFFGAWL